VKLSTELERNDLAGLERVAEGRSSTLSGPVMERLLALGLVQKSGNPIDAVMSLQLTTAGLSLIHSSDQ
jgi:hypothetical protein